MNKPIKVEETELIRFINERTDDFELMLVITAAWDEVVFRAVRPRIRMRKTPTEDTLFRNPKYEALWAAVEALNGVIVDSGNRLPQGYSIPFNLIFQQLQTFAQGARIIALSEVQHATEMYTSAWEMYANTHTQARVAAGWRFWLLARTKVQVLQMSMRYGDMDVAKELSDMTRALSDRAEAEGMMTLRDTITKQDKPVIRIPTGLPSLDRALGGGFGIGEGNLVLGPSGCGKSVFSAQTSYEMSAQGLGHKGLLIHTEMTGQDYANRIISNKCKIPYSLIKDGFKFEAITDEEQRRRYEMLMSDIDTKWLRFRWQDVGRTGIFTHIDDLLKQAEDKMGGLDHAHLDWLGGALTKVAVDPSQLRMVWQAAADACAELAERKKISFTVYAQAHPKDALNKRKVGPKMASECKSLHREMTTAIGISAIHAVAKPGADESAAEEKTYRDEQFLFLGKSRKSEGGLVPFRRRFDQMRIEPM